MSFTTPMRTLAVALVATACSATNREEAVRLAVWEYQLSTYSRSLLEAPCIGIVNGIDNAEVEDPTLGAIGALNTAGIRVKPASSCGAGGLLRGFLLGPISYEGHARAIVEGTALEGHYRYDVELSDGRWWVRGGMMTAIY